jgi:hypothetical protein
MPAVLQMMRLALPVLLLGALALYDGLSVDEKGWLYALAVLAAGAACMRLLLRIRRPWAFALGTLALLVVAHLVAFLIWAPFIAWD